MDNNEIFDKYQILLEENEKLKRENEELKRLLRLTETCSNIDEQVLSNTESSSEDQISGVCHITNISSAEDKVRLFASLFRGRDDVYAKRWQNKEGKLGYSPVCINEWVRGICNKPKIKCSECNNKKYCALDSSTIDKHLRGKEVLGLYPLLCDEACYLLAIDFDDEGWQGDISVVREICKEKNIPVAVERSRSGSGAHMWFFFEEKISSASARKFGTALLTYAMNKRHEIKFKRMIGYFQIRIQCLKVD
jgi:hypothetical protein